MVGTKKQKGQGYHGRDFECRKPPLKRGSGKPKGVELGGFGSEGLIEMEREKKKTYKG